MPSAPAWRGLAETAGSESSELRSGRETAGSESSELRSGRETAGSESARVASPQLRFSPVSAGAGAPKRQRGRVCAGVAASRLPSDSGPRRRQPGVCRPSTRRSRPWPRRPASCRAPRPLREPSHSPACSPPPTTRAGAEPRLRSVGETARAAREPRLPGYRQTAVAETAVAGAADWRRGGAGGGRVEREAGSDRGAPPPQQTAPESVGDARGVWGSHRGTNGPGKLRECQRGGCRRRVRRVSRRRAAAPRGTPPGEKRRASLIFSIRRSTQIETAARREASSVLRRSPSDVSSLSRSSPTSRGPPARHLALILARHVSHVRPGGWPGLLGLGAWGGGGPLL